MITFLFLLAMLAAKQYPPNADPARVYPGAAEKAGRAQDGRPESPHTYPSGTEPAHNGNAGLAIAKER